MEGGDKVAEAERVAEGKIGDKMITERKRKRKDKNCSINSQERGGRRGEGGKAKESPAPYRFLLEKEEILIEKRRKRMTKCHFST